MEELLTYIETHGLAVVFFVVVLYFLIKFANIRLKVYEEKNTTKSHDKLTLIRTEIGSDISDLLKRTMYKTDASRAYIFEFHNGVSNLGGLPFLKMSNTYEELNQGAKSEMHLRTDVSFSLYPSFVDAIYKNDYVVIDINNRTNEYSEMLYTTLKDRDISTTVRCKITDTNGTVIGFLGIDYCLEKETLNEEELKKSINEVTYTAIEIGAFLSVKKDEGE